MLRGGRAVGVGRLSERWATGGQYAASCKFGAICADLLLAQRVELVDSCLHLLAIRRVDGGGVVLGAVCVAFCGCDVSRTWLFFVVG